MSRIRGPLIRLATMLVALLLLSGAALWAARAGGGGGSAPPKPGGAPGSLSGRITAAGGKKLPEMVVYLEPVNPSAAAKFDVPKEPVVLSQRDAKFLPSLVVIAAGQSVDFRNDERRPIEHNVFSRTPGTEFNLGLYKPGTPDKVVRFETPGAVRLYCSIHRYMDGVVYVCPTPLFSKVNRDGTYRIDNIPPGEYRLKTWQRNARFEDREVAVRVAGATDAELNLEMSRK